MPVTPAEVSKLLQSMSNKSSQLDYIPTSLHNVCKAAHFHIRALRHIRGCIDEETACMVASSIIGSRLDYCNSVLHETSAKNLGKLQQVVHVLARVVSGTRRSNHITPVLARLHWLPVVARITFKITLITFKAIPTKNLSISPKCSTSRPRQRHFDLPRETVSCERCQNCLRQSRFPSCRTLNLEQSPGSPDWPVFNTGVFQKTT